MMDMHIHQNQKIERSIQKVNGRRRRMYINSGAIAERKKEKNMPDHVNYIRHTSS